MFLGNVLNTFGNFSYSVAIYPIERFRIANSSRKPQICCIRKPCPKSSIGPWRYLVILFEKGRGGTAAFSRASLKIGLTFASMILSKW